MATQTCDRTVTGRNFDYDSAVSVIQEEDYLEDEDFDDIRFFRRHGNIIEAIENFEDKISNFEDSEHIKTFDWNFENENHLHREKRQASCPSCDELEQIVEDYCVLVTSSPGNPACTPTIVQTFLDGRGQGSCPFSNCPTPAPAVVPPPEVDTPTLGGGAAAVLAAALLIFALNPSPGEFPSGSPVPGSPFGGGLPNTNPGNILANVPAGLTPVAVFPPFATPRTVPAVAVIWREPAGTQPGVPLRKKRSSGYSPQPSFLDRFLKNIRCLRPRLTARFGRKPAPVVGYGYHGKKKNVNRISVTTISKF